MPIFLLFVGVLLIVVGVNNKLSELGTLVKEDFRPSGNVPAFQVWILAIFCVGAIGYVKSLRPFANAFLVLVMVGLFLSNKGFITKFSKAIEGK